ncbi:MAG: pilus assembly protein TadG-related protein [Tepidisphaeraceae bacterium]
MRGKAQGNMTSIGKRHRRALRGMALLWVTVAMTLFCAIGSLAMDYGRIQVVRSELHRAADAAARAAAANLAQPSAARRIASEYASRNIADGSPVELLVSKDVELGTWDHSSRKFSPLTGPRENAANAVRVTAYRIAARSTAVPLLWASLLGQNTCDVRAVAICAVGGANYGIIGLDWVAMQGNSTSSYWPGGASNGGSFGSVASNGNITLSGDATINGDARPGIGMTATGGRVSGSRESLDVVLSFPAGDAGTYATVNDNNQLPRWACPGDNLVLAKNRQLTAPGGTYYFRDVITGGSSTIRFSGPTTIYCWGRFDMNANTTTAADLPTNLKIVMCTGPQGQRPGPLSINAGANFYAQVYAPQSAVTVTGGGDIFGSVLGKTVDMSGTGRIHYDLSLNTGGGITMVK